MSTDATPRYDGPLPLAAAKTALSLAAAAATPFTRDGPRADVEYRDLGLAAASGGRIGAKHIRAIMPLARETGWHWHDMTGHFVYVLKGWITFRFAGVAEPVTVEAGGCLSQPAGVAHNVVARADDLELIEINLPAVYGTFELPQATPGGAGDGDELGDADAPVTIIEYASMTCPHCAAFHETTLPVIKEKYLDTGKAKLIFREFPFDPRAAAAFMLARCAPENQYFPLISVLFKQQQVWAGAPDPRPPLLPIAKVAGFTQESFEACLKNQEMLDNVLAVKTRAESRFKVSSTPTFFINGEKHSGALSVEQLSKIIDSHL